MEGNSIDENRFELTRFEYYDIMIMVFYIASLRHYVIRIIFILILFLTLILTLSYLS